MSEAGDKIKRITELVRELTDEEIEAYYAENNDLMKRPQPIMRRVGTYRSLVLQAIIGLRDAASNMPY